MSTDWDVVCADCGPDDRAHCLGMHDFRGWSDLEALVRHRHILEAMAALMRETDGDLMLMFGFYGNGPRVDPEYFIRHKGHRLRVRSEYGDYADECSEWYDPGSPAVRLTTVYADKHKKCTRPVKHEGEHGQRPR